MIRALSLTVMIGSLSLFSSLAEGQQNELPPPPPTSSGAISTSSDVAIVQVRNGRYRNGYRYSYRYPAYGYQYNYRPYGYYYRPYNYYYPRYYGTRRFGYYDYGFGRGTVRVGPIRVWW